MPQFIISADRWTRQIITLKLEAHNLEEASHLAETTNFAGGWIEDADEPPRDLHIFSIIEED